MASEEIPFVFTKSDLELVQKVHSDASMCRVLLENHEVWGELDQSKWLWIDTGIDAVNHFLKRPYRADPESEIVRLFARSEFDWLVSRDEVIVDGNPKVSLSVNGPELLKPPKVQVQKLVAALLKECLSIPNAGWLSIPHIGIAGNGGVRENALNIAFAKASGEVSIPEKRYLIQPICVVNKTQYETKAARKKVVELARRLVDASNAKGVWVVDHSLEDLSVTAPMKQRLLNLKALHVELQEGLSPLRIVSAGPYWCMNLSLWATGLAWRPAIGLGGRYQYHWSHGFAQAAKDRVVLLPLRRWTVTDGLTGWLRQVAEQHGIVNSTPSSSNPLAPEGVAQGPSGGVDSATIAELHRILSLLNQSPSSSALRDDRAAKYKEWLSEIAVANPTDRAITCFGLLSKAYATGKILGTMVGELPKESGPIQRQPGGVAATHMDVAI